MTTKEAVTIKPQKKRTAEHLKPYQFKPGNNANPKGRPKSIITKKQRQQLLSEYAKMNPEKANPVTAIDLLNKMDRIYSDFPAGLQDNRQYNIYISGEEAKKKLEMLLAGERPQIGGSQDAI